jgi:hypothetical protein
MGDALMKPLRTIPHLLLLGILAVVSYACSEPLEFADWLLPVPEGTSIYEYAAVPFEARDQHIELVEDLVIGQRDDDPDYILYRANSLQVDADGNIFVLDSGNSRVQMFDAAGEYVRTFGRRGQGPAEIGRPGGLALAGERVVVRDTANRRYGMWSRDGAHLTDVPYPSRDSPLTMQGLADGTVLGRVAVLDPDRSILGGPPGFRLVWFDAEMVELATIHEFPPVELPLIVRRSDGGASFARVMVPAPDPSHAATDTGEVYASLCEEYQIYAYDAAGAMRWALRVAWQRGPISEAEIVTAIERARVNMPDASRSEVDFPERRPALRRIAVDGHGHLFAFPYEEADDPDPDTIPVDVYSPTGAHLFSGWMPNLAWSDARGDFVYDLESDDDSGEERIIRYRIVEPFE